MFILLNNLGKNVPTVICLVTVWDNFMLPFSPNSKFATEAGRFGY